MSKTKKTEVAPNISAPPTEVSAPVQSFTAGSIQIDTVGSLRRWIKSVKGVHVRTQLNGDPEAAFYAPAIKGAFITNIETFPDATSVHAELRSNNDLYVG